MILEMLVLITVKTSIQMLVDKMAILTIMNTSAYRSMQHNQNNNQKRLKEKCKTTTKQHHTNVIMLMIVFILIRHTKKKLNQKHKTAAKPLVIRLLLE
jgi:hypothetical protein